MNALRRELARLAAQLKPAEDADSRSLLADVPEGIFLDGWP
jgi:hypothetical protein